jgi:hypothetical protein
VTLNPIYLGDGAYAEQGHWAGEVCVYTSNGINRTNAVYLEIEALDQLHAWAHGGQA